MEMKADWKLAAEEYRTLKNRTEGLSQLTIDIRNQMQQIITEQRRELDKSNQKIAELENKLDTLLSRMVGSTR